MAFPAAPRTCIIAGGEIMNTKQLPLPGQLVLPAARETGVPGLVCQFIVLPDGRFRFPYLSEGCHSLLGVPAAQLQRQPELLLELVLPTDREGFRRALRDSTATLSLLNWEGRIRIEQWNDEKWINLRATPYTLHEPAGAVQWDGIMTNITASRREQEQLGEAHARLAELTAHIEQAKEQERARIAREIHDDLGGNLTAIKMALAMLARRLPPGDAQLLDKANYVDCLVDRTIDAVHRISLDLRPSVLDFGLRAALEWQCTEFEKQNGVKCALAAAEVEVELAPDRATALFRIFQEALTNIAKHARASSVTVRLHHGDGQLTLAVTDDGIGIAPADRSKPRSFGLRGMAERAQALGGELAIAPEVGGGTTLAVRIPLTAGQSG